jgi:predicted nucleotidyltransferase
MVAGTSTRVQVHNGVTIDRGRIAEFCHRWDIQELALFGSVLRSDFRDDSDIDVLVSFVPDAPWNLLDFVRMREELGELLGRTVDAVERRALTNPFRRREVLSRLEVLYAT